MKVFITATFILLFSNAVLSQKKIVAGSKKAPMAKKIIVFTTAEKTGYRLTATDTLQFAFMGQPKETQPCVFIDPSKSFQTFIGIGGALTDASAETFYMLPKDEKRNNTSLF